MIEIDFTTILDLDSEHDFLLELLADFKKETGIQVKLTRMQWSDAWDQLLRIATHGQGADLSLVFVSSLPSRPNDKH